MLFACSGAASSLVAARLQVGLPHSSYYMLCEVKRAKRQNTAIESMVMQL